LVGKTISISASSLPPKVLFFVKKKKEKRRSHTLSHIFSTLLTKNVIIVK